jgi:hypothetical protein
MRRNFNTTNLVPEEYGGYKIYIAKVQNKYHSWYAYKIYDPQTKIFIDKGTQSEDTFHETDLQFGH